MWKVWDTFKVAFSFVCWVIFLLFLLSVVVRVLFG